MDLHIKLFGQLIDTAGSKHLTLPYVKDTHELLNLLQEKFPAIYQSKFVVAVNNQVAAENTLITPDSAIALLPPFSGG